MTSLSRSDLIDALRTLAILCMVVFHIAYDLQHFYGWEIDVSAGFWKSLQLFTATLFLLLVGYSAVLSHQRRYVDPSSMLQQWIDQRTRLLWIGGSALLVSIVTYIIDPLTFVRFGILHLIAVATILTPLIYPLKHDAIALGGFFLLFQSITEKMHLHTSLFLPLGITPPIFHTVDYFPLIPWFGVICIGMGLAHVIAPPRINLPRMLTWPGRHALILYLIHQPVIMMLLTLILGMPT